MEALTLNRRDEYRAKVLVRMQAEHLSYAQVAGVLGLSVRQVRRLSQAFLRDGAAAVVHGNRGREPRNKTDPALRTRVVALAGPDGELAGISVSHTQSLLLERHDITIARSTLDDLLRREKIIRSKGRGKGKRRYLRREREPCEGMLVQIDASDHLWLAKRGPRMCLTGAIDDATSRILHLRFYQSECLEGYLRLIQDIAEQHGLPLAFYHDRHTILRSPKEPTIDDDLAGREPMSQIQRVMDELGIESVAALTPQAKGRVERMWGTLQDRLTTELRLEKINGMDEANEYLDKFIAGHNRRFAVEPANATPAWEEMPADLDTVRYFSTQEWRSVSADQCLQYCGRQFMIRDKRSYAHERVAVHVPLGGEVAVYGGPTAKQRLTYKEITQLNSGTAQGQKPTRLKYNRAAVAAAPTAHAG